MDDVAVGRGLRALRIRQGWSQRELASRAAVDPSVIGDIEGGRLELVRLPTIRRAVKPLGVSIQIAPRWPVADVARLLDAGHAALVEHVLRSLARFGWATVAEYTFNDYGERGSVDVLGWQEVRGALAIVEVKTRIADVQDLHAAFDRKARVVPKLVAREKGWRPVAVGRILVIAEGHGNRDRVRRHATIFGIRFPEGSRAAQRWIREPAGDLGALWFLPVP